MYISTNDYSASIVQGSTLVARFEYQLAPQYQHLVMNLLGTFQPRLVTIPSVVIGIVVLIDDQTWLQGAIKASVWVIFQRPS
jgi:hypothetical protein